MLDLAPYSAHAATTKAKIIPKIILILSFLYINLLSLSTSSLPHLISIREASLEASYGCLSKLAYLPRLILWFTFTTSAKRAAATANVIPNIIINILCHKWLLSLKIVTDLQFYLFFLINLLSSNHLILLPANSVFGIYTLAVDVNNLSLFLKYAVDVVFILRPHFLINVSKSTFGT
jgi:hypothetical protein